MLQQVAEKKKPRSLSGAFPWSYSRLHQVQTIEPVELSQVLEDCECVDVAVHVCGGPATVTAVIVTFCDGVKPWRGEVDVAVPAK